MKFLDRKIVTERELIELTIEWGFDGKELETATFKQRGCLKPNGTMNKLIAKGLTRYDSVELMKDEKGEVLTGKDRRYVLEGLKDSPTKRITGNATNGTPPTEFDEVIEEYFFNLLVKRVAPREDGWSETYNLWGSNWINQLVMSDTEWASYHTLLKNTFREYSDLSEEHIKEIFSNVKDNLNRNLRGLAVKLIERLEKKERIETDIEFYQVFAEGSLVADFNREMEKELKYEDKKFSLHYKIDEYKHLEIVEGITQIIAPLGMVFGRYKIVSAFPHYATDEEKVIIKIVGEWLFDCHSVDYLYNRIRIWVTDATILMEVSEQEKKDAFANRIIEKTNKRMNRKDYKTTPKYTNAFYRLSVFLLLDMKKVKGLGEQIKMESKMIKDAIENCKYHYAIEHGVDLDQQEQLNIARGQFGIEIEGSVKPKVVKDVELQNHLASFFDETYPKDTPIEETPIPVEVVKPEIVNEDLIWMNKFPSNKKKSEIKPVATFKKPVEIQTIGRVDIASIVAEEEKPVEKQIDNRPFGWQIEAHAEAKQPKLDEKLMPSNKEYRIPPKTPNPSSSLYLMEMEAQMLYAEGA